MFNMFAGWGRLMAAGATVTQTGLRTLEAIGAANEVVSARTMLIGAAMHSPLDSDNKELARMVPEKIEAFSRAGSATVTALWAGHAAWMEQVRHLGTLSTRGRPPSPAELLDLGDRMATLSLDSIDATAKLGAAALAPVHKKVTDNARRLKRKSH